MESQIEQGIDVDFSVLEGTDLFYETYTFVVSGRGGCVFLFHIREVFECVFEFEFADQGHGYEVCAGACVAFCPDDHFSVVTVAYDQGDVGVVASFLRV